MLFSFSDRKLFQIVVVYNRTSTEGLTVDDVIDRVSLDYGVAGKTEGDAELIFPSMFQESAKVPARGKTQKLQSTSLAQRINLRLDSSWSLKKWNPPPERLRRKRSGSIRARRRNERPKSNAGK